MSVSELHLGQPPRHKLQAQDICTVALGSGAIRLGIRTVYVSAVFESIAFKLSFPCVSALPKNIVVTHI
jgi:hypothetical protein